MIKTYLKKLNLFSVGDLSAENQPDVRASRAHNT